MGSPVAAAAVARDGADRVVRPAAVGPGQLGGTRRSGRGGRGASGGAGCSGSAERRSGGSDGSGGPGGGGGAAVVVGGWRLVRRSGRAPGPAVPCRVGRAVRVRLARAVLARPSAWRCLARPALRAVGAGLGAVWYGSSAVPARDFGADAAYVVLMGRVARGRVRWGIRAPARLAGAGGHGRRSPSAVPRASADRAPPAARARSSDGSACRPLDRSSSKRTRWRRGRWRHRRLGGLVPRSCGRFWRWRPRGQPPGGHAGIPRRERRGESGWRPSRRSGHLGLVGCRPDSAIDDGRVARRWRSCGWFWTGHG